VAYSSNRTTSNAKRFNPNKNLRLDNMLASDKKPVKIGDKSTGLLLADNEVFIEKSPTNENHIANKKYVDSFTYQFINCGYYANSATGNFIPINGYVFERTSTSSQNEFIAFVAPYNGSVHKVMWRSEIAQNGDTIFAIHESADGTEVPALVPATSLTEAVDIADDTTHTFDINNLSSNTLTKGNIYAFKIDHPTAPYDTNVTVVIKWDLT
jgi:hemin uptake protein HemP